MAKEKAVYEPGELDRVRNKLGVIDDKEAKRLAEKLGGDVGVERSESPPAESAKGAPIVRRNRGGGGAAAAAARAKSARGGAAESGQGGKSAGSQKSQAEAKQPEPTDDNPKVPINANYFERLKMDRYAGEEEFGIKSFSQVMIATFSFFSRPPDYINPAFITKRLPVYFKKIELLVNETRVLFPRNNRALNDKVKRTSIFVFAVLDTIRYWNIEKIAGDLSRMQAVPKNVKLKDLSETLRAIYKPLFILERLNTEAHIRESYKILYRLLFIEDPVNAKRKYEALIDNAMAAFTTIRENIHHLLYPLLMKLLSSTFIPYERFFTERRNRFLAFLNATDEERIDPVIPKEEEVKQDSGGEEEEAGDPRPDDGTGKAESGNDKERQKQDAEEAEQKTYDQSLRTMEALFPRAGWEKLDTYPDLYPYFRGVFNLKKDYELIAPTDALQQAVMLTRIIQELFLGLRYVIFSAVPIPQSSDSLDIQLSDIINNWPNHEVAFEKEYISRLSEYCRLLEGSDRGSDYTKRLYTEIQWLRKMFFFPYYQIETFGPPPFSRNSVPAIYSDVRRLRKLLAVVADGIEEANKNGGIETSARCPTIENPWDQYSFQVGNPLSTRMNMLLGQKRRTNVTLVSFSLMAVSVLDHILNRETGWGYPAEVGPLFRSVNGEGTIPQFGVDEKIDANLLFKQIIKEQRERKKQS